ncbi:phosphate-starvation-inducible PsiE family protein [Leptolyngbya sp. FACHB-16]|nr:phosphate-starvation-inducible PsiE family protein [Leptolyngbya sp. FACHB-8]MBD2154850.1 phosphate-starvation-inducible PsiE family protein [Leptolyngbya sp. FACHB-16]
MIVVLIVASVDLWRVMIRQLVFEEPYGSFTSSLLEIFGLFLNVLVALEVLENISAYLKKHVVQVELVIVTSLTAVARKIIILDSKSTTGVELIGLGVAVLALAGGYWIVRHSNRHDRNQNSEHDQNPDHSDHD